MKKNVLALLIILFPIAFVVLFLWFLYGRDDVVDKLSYLNVYTREELRFLKEQGFLDGLDVDNLPRNKEQTVSAIKSKELIEQSLDNNNESFNVLASKIDLKKNKYQMAFKLENKTNQPKDFYLIPISSQNQTKFEGIFSSEKIKQESIDKPLAELYNIQEHKSQLRPELANAYSDIELKNYQAKPVKITLEPKSTLLATSEWNLRRGPSSSDLEPVYLLVQGSAGGAMDSLTILTVHSSPQQGENWEVEFETRGTSDLKIIPNDQATIDDDEFVGLYCDDQQRTPQILAGDVIYYPDWQCSSTGKVVHYTLKAGNHTLRFEFAGQTSFAYNSPGVTKQFIIGGTVDDPINDNTTEYAGLMGDGEIAWNATEASHEQVIPTAGKLSNFQVSVQAPPNTGNSWTFTIRKTNSDTALSVTIADSATLSSVDTDEVTVAAGDKVAISATGTSTPDLAARASWTVQFTPTIEGETILMANTAGNNLTANYYNTLIGGKIPDATEFDGQTLFPASGTLKKLYVELGTAPGGVTSRTFTIRLNGVAQSLTTTISNTSTTNSDTSNTVSVTAGDNITIINTVSGSPAASIAKFGVVFVPITQGQWFTSATSDDTLNTGTTTEYQHLTCGDSAIITTESEQLGLAQATTAKAIYVELSVGAGKAADYYDFTLRRNATTTTTLTCRIQGTATTCNYATDVTISANDLLSTIIVPTHSPTGGPASQISYLFYNLPINQVPAVSKVEDGPDAIQVGQTIKFDVAWSDADVEGVKMLICKTDAINESSTPSCQGGEWCSYKNDYFTTNPLSCNYTITSGDVGVKSYYAFVCDNEPDCNTSGTAGTFTVNSATPMSMRFDAKMIFDFKGIIGRCSGDYCANPSWSKVADTTVRDIAADYNDTVAKDIYCDDDNCILYTDGQVPPKSIFFSNVNLYAGVIWSKTDDSTSSAWGPTSSIAGGDIGGTHPAVLRVGAGGEDISNLNWLARNYVSAPGTYSAMDVCKAKGDGWSLPNILELDSIRKSSSPCSDLPNITSNGYWASSESTSSNAYYLSCGSGDVYANLKTSNYYVRCVKR